MFLTSALALPIGSHAYVIGEADVIEPWHVACRTQATGPDECMVTTSVSTQILSRRRPDLWVISAARFDDGTTLTIVGEKPAVRAELRVEIERWVTAPRRSRTCAYYDATATALIARMAVVGSMRVRVIDGFLVKEFTVPLDGFGAALLELPRG